MSSGGLVQSRIDRDGHNSEDHPKSRDRGCRVSAPTFTRPSCVLNVSNLTRNTNEEHLREIFCEYGKVISVKVAVDNLTRLPRGYGYVQFETRDQAEEAQRCLNGGQLDGQVIKVEFLLLPSPSPRQFNKNYDNIANMSNHRRAWEKGMIMSPKHDSWKQRGEIGSRNRVRSNKISPSPKRHHREIRQLENTKRRRQLSDSPPTRHRDDRSVENRKEITRHSRSPQRSNRVSRGLNKVRKPQNNRLRESPSFRLPRGRRTSHSISRSQRKLSRGKKIEYKKRHNRSLTRSHSSRSRCLSSPRSRNVSPASSHNSSSISSSSSGSWRSGRAAH